MPRRGVVFVGPSLAERPWCPALTFRPPARRGDLLRAVDEGFDLLGLVDGEFLQSLAVSPAEVRACARAGATLFGAASMGALRAGDCPDAMTAVGAIAAGYQSGRILREDEVALTYDPDTYAPIAWPLVELRAALALARRRGLLGEAQAAAVVRSLARLHFPERTAARLRREVEARGADAGAVLACLADPACRLKRADATALVERLAALVADGGGGTSAPSPGGQRGE